MGVKIPVVLDHTKEEDCKERDRLVLENMRLVYKYVNDFYTGAKIVRQNTYPREDAVSDGFHALVHAAARYRPDYLLENGEYVKFSTYAVRWIQSWIQKGYMQSRLVYDKSSHTRWDFSNSLKFEPLWYKDDSGDSYELEDDSSDVVESVDKIETREYVRSLLRLLDKMDRRILEMRFFEHRTLQSIALELGVTRERVRQKQVRALERIREICNLQQIREQING